MGQKYSRGKDRMCGPSPEFFIAYAEEVMGSMERLERALVEGQDINYLRQ